MSDGRSDYKKVAVDFLLYSYFGLSLDDLDGDCEKEIKYAAINKAYGDAARHVLRLPELSSPDEKTFREIGTKWLMDNVGVEKDAVTLINEFYENKEIKAIRDKCDEKNAERKKNAESGKKENEYGISQGHIQKWVNMSYKYLCIIYTIKKEFVGGENPYEKFADSDRYHIPVDRYILKEAKFKENKEGYTWSTAKDYRKMEYYVTDSQSFKEKGDKSKYEWENDVWIRQSKAERKTSDKIRKRVLKK